MTGETDPYTTPQGDMHVSEEMIVDIMSQFGSRGELDDKLRYGLLSSGSSMTVWFEDEEGQGIALRLQLQTVVDGTTDFCDLTKNLEMKAPEGKAPCLLFEAKVVQVAGGSSGKPAFECDLVFGLVTPNGNVAVIDCDPTSERATRMWRATIWMHAGQDLAE